MTSAIPDPELAGFLALLATRRAPRTVDAYRRDLGQLATWRKGRVGDTTTEELERWLAEMRAAGVAASTVARRVAAVRGFFRHQLLLGTREDNPAAALQLPRRTRTLPRTLSPAEAERLIDAAAGTSPRSLRDRALVELLYGAGLRVSEATGLHRRSVDLDDRVVRALGKGSKERLVPLGPPGRRSAAALHRVRPPSPRPPRPGRAVPERARRPAHPGRRVPDPASARGEGRARAAARAPAPAPSLVRDAPARGRRRPPQRPGDARPRRPLDNGALHARIRPEASRVVLPSAPACATTYDLERDALR